MNRLALAVLAAAPLAVQAHPGHGETLHAHPELYVAIVVVATAVAYFRRDVVRSK